MKNASQPIYPILDWNIVQSNSWGLTKREYFAGLAMQGLCSYNGTMNDHTVESTTKRAIEIADEILKQLKP